MAQSYPWLSVGEAASRLHIGEHDVLELAVLGILPSRLVVNAREVDADTVTRLDEQIRFASECAAQQGEAAAESASGPSVRGGERLPLDIEHDYERERET
jgi:hypothetical protein